MIENSDKRSFNHSS